MKVPVAVLAAAALAASAIPAYCQTASPASSPDNPVLTLRTSVQVVEVSIVATGAKGAPAEDLTAGDFRVWDNGKERTIASFEKLSLATPSGTALPAGIYSNRIADSERIGKEAQPQVLTMILLDAVNTKYRFQTWGRRAVISILEQLEPNERVAIYALGSRFRTIHGFSSDKESLLARLRAYHGEVPGSEDLLQDFDLDMGAASQPIDPTEKDNFDSNRIVDTYGALEAIANAMRGVSGRKNLIWVSGGLPMARLATGRWTVRNFGPEVKRAMRALNDANISVYPIYARGLSVMSIAAGREMHDIATDVEWSEISTFKSVAAATGGKIFYNNNDLGRGVREALDDSRVVYTLTYNADLPASDSAYHQIRVETTRHGVRLRYRPGYYATGKQEAAPMEEADRLTELIRSPRDLPGIGLQGVIETAPDRAGEVSVLVRVNAADLDLVPDADTWSGEIRLGAMQLGAGGEMLGGATDSGEVRLEQTPYQRALENGLLFRLKFQRNPAAVAVRVGLVEERGGRMGSMSLRLLPVRGAPAKTRTP